MEVKTNKQTNKKQTNNEKGGSSGHNAQEADSNANAHTMKMQALNHLGKLISELNEFVKPKINVHKEIKAKVAGIGSAFKRLKALEDTQAIVVPEVMNKPTTPRRRTETTTTVDTDVDADCESVAGDKRETRKAKRRLRPSPEVANEKKKRKETGPTSSPRNENKPPDKKETTNWQKVLPKKKKKQQNRKQWPSVNRPSALIVRPKEKGKYAEILSRVKKDVPDDQVRASVDKIRRTATGDLLIILTKDNTDGGQTLQKTISGILGDNAKVISKEPQEEIEIRDLDEMATKEEILEALQKATGDAGEITLNAIKSLRKAYAGTQSALVTLATPMVKKVLGDHGKIRIGWVNCRVRTLERPTKCFRCWRYGHLAAKCKSDVDRSNSCSKCGEEGHKSATCKKDARCTLCTEKGDMKNCAHIAGSSRCPVFKEALQKVRNKKRP